MSRKTKQRKKGKAQSKAIAASSSASTKDTARRDSAHSTPHRVAPWLDTALLVLVAAGIALTAYLTLNAWLGDHPAYCGPDSGCDLVQSSRWSTLFGLPMSFWGLLTYALLARCLWRLRSRPSAWRMALLVASIGAGVSWFLTIVSMIAIEATCAYCLASFLIINAILILLLIRRPAHLPEHAWAKAAPMPVGITAAVVLALQLHFSGLFDPAAGPEDPYLRALATHLSESGAHFYGAYWCPHCNDQKELFGASVHRLPYVECTPEGRGGKVNLSCLDANVRDYPTWEIRGQQRSGVISPKELARLSRFQWAGGG